MRPRQTPLGCKRDAQAAWDAAHGRPNLTSSVRFVGCGLYRRVYCDKTERIVYKIELQPEKEINLEENAMAVEGRAAGLPYLPPTWIWWITDRNSVEHPVLAMPYYALRVRDVPSAKAVRVFEAIIQALPWAYTIDLHDDNYRFTRNGRAVVTDIQGF